jgi:hypothetical protein
VVKVTGGHDTRVSLAALIAVRPGCGPRLIWRTHLARRADKRKGFTEQDYARFLDAAHQQLGRPGRPGLGRPEHAHQPGDARADRRPRVADDLPAAGVCAGADPVKPVWSVLKRSLANLVKQDIDQLTALVRTRLRRMQYRPALLEGFLAKPGLDLGYFHN